MSKRGRKGKETVGDLEIRSTKPLLAIEVGNPPWDDPETDSIGEKSLDHSVESPVHGFTDHLSPEIEGSILTEENLTTLIDK